VGVGGGLGVGEGVYFFDDVGKVLEWRGRYYRDQRVLYLMIAYLRGRETCLLSAGGGFTNARHMKCHSVQFLKSNFNAFDFMNKDFMVYYSLARYVNHPVFSYNPTERSLQQKEWGEKMKDYVVGYDLFFDFDAHGRVFKDVRRSGAYRDCKALRDFLRRFGVRYRINFSGSGFHLVVPYEEFSEFGGSVKDFSFIGEGTVYNFCMRVRQRLVDRLGLGTCDLSTVDAARVAKCCWSFSKYGTVAVVFANDGEFDGFKVEQAHPAFVLNRKDLVLRGEEFTNLGVKWGFGRLLKALRKW